MKTQLFKESPVCHRGLLATVIATILSGTTGLSQDLQLNPDIGQIVITYPVTLELADSSTNGTNQVWDFSGVLYDSGNPETITYRVPTSQELANFPQTNTVAESDIGTPSYYHVAADSLSLLGGTASNGNPLFFGNPRVRAFYPYNSGELYTDEASYTYTSGTAQIVVVQQSQWEIVGSGTLITPLQTYNDAYKVKTSSQLAFYVNGMPNVNVETTQFEWFTPGISSALLSIAYDDYNDTTEAKVLGAEGMAALAEQMQAPVGVYPNPADDRVTIEGTYDRYELVDATGRIVLAGTGQEIILGTLAPDQYVLVVFRNGSPAGRTKIVRL